MVSGDVPHLSHRPRAVSSAWITTAYRCRRLWSALAPERFLLTRPGKQSLTRLSSFICEQSVFQIKVSGSYGLSDFKQDVSTLYTKTGSKNLPTTFILTDSQVCS